ncbi:MAG: hypothetical protein ACLT1W_12375 [Alistipes onderdonkii]
MPGSSTGRVHCSCNGQEIRLEIVLGFQHRDVNGSSRDVERAAATMLAESMAGDSIGPYDGLARLVEIRFGRIARAR